MAQTRWYIIFIYFIASQQPVAINLTNTGGATAKILTSNQQGSIGRVATSSVPFSEQAASGNSTAQLLASADKALNSSAHIQQISVAGGSSITTIAGTKISLPTQPARFVALPTQPAAMVII